MKIAVVGAGAVGGLIAGRLVGRVADAEVSVLARGQTLARLRESGLTVYEPDPAQPGSHLETFSGPVRACATAAEAGVQDVVFICLKYNGLADLAPTLIELMGLAKPEEMTGKSLIRR